MSHKSDRIMRHRKISGWIWNIYTKTIQIKCRASKIVINSARTKNFFVCFPCCTVVDQHNTTWCGICIQTMRFLTYSTLTLVYTCTVFPFNSIIPCCVVGNLDMNHFQLFEHSKFDQFSVFVHKNKAHHRTWHGGTRKYGHFFDTNAKQALKWL